MAVSGDRQEVANHQESKEQSLNCQYKDGDSRERRSTSGGVGGGPEERDTIAVAIR